MPSFISQSKYDAMSANMHSDGTLQSILRANDSHKLTLARKFGVSLTTRDNPFASSKMGFIIFKGLLTFGYVEGLYCIPKPLKSD